MLATQNHRGPDGRGSYVDRLADGSVVALGHNRLSIIDVSEHAAQPMRSADGRYVFVYNGEVYNYREIAADLGGQELPQGSTGDSAVIMAALIKWGPTALAQ